MENGYIRTNDMQKDDTKRSGKIESRFVSVAVNNIPRSIDLLHMTYAQQNIIGSGGYMPEDVTDVQKDNVLWEMGLGTYYHTRIFR